MYMRVIKLMHVNADASTYTDPVCAQPHCSLYPVSSKVEMQPDAVTPLADII